MSPFIRQSTEEYLRQINNLLWSTEEQRNDGVQRILERYEALWIHNGDPKRPHAELTSGKCSNGFVDVLRALRFSEIGFAAAHGLAALIRRRYSGPIDWVVGSDHAGAVFSQNVAIHLGAKHDFTEKGEGKTQNWKRFKIREDEVVLQVEELMKTSGTFLAVREGIRTGNDGVPVTFAPVAGVLVHRSAVWKVEDTDIIPFVHYNISVWEPSECPLCKAGSPRLRPKQHWAELTGKA